MPRAKGIGSYNPLASLKCREGREFTRRAGPYISPFKCSYNSNYTSHFPVEMYGKTCGRLQRIDANSTNLHQT